MITALDSSMILDVLTGNPRFADSAEQLLRRSSAEGRLIIGERVAGNLPAFKGKEDFGKSCATGRSTSSRARWIAARWPARISPSTCSEAEKRGACCRIS